MNIAICAPFLEADVLEYRIRDAVPEERLFVDEYYSVDALLALPSLSDYEAVWVALPGAVGMEAVRAVRAHNRDIPIVWMSADKQIVWGGVGCALAMFLTPESTTEEFRIAVENSRMRRQEAW